MGTWRITVNGTPIEMDSENATGRQIREAARVSSDIPLLLERNDGQTVIIEDDQVITPQDGNELWALLPHISA
jgi:hypothetical protein